MSHVADVDLKVEDLDALEAAAAVLGGKLVRGQKNYRWYGQFMNDWHNPERAAAMRGHDPKSFGKGEHAIVVDGASYDVGVVKARDGKGYELVYDAWGPGAKLEQVFGRGMHKLRDEYAAAVATKHMVRRGYVVSRQYNPAGELQLVGRKR